MEIQKQGYKTETFLVTVNEFGQRIYTSQTNPYKSYIIDEHGTMVEYIPQYSSSESNGDTNDSEIPQCLEENSRELEAQLDMMSPLEEREFEDTLMNELDSGIMGMTPYVRPDYLMEHMDIVEPLSKLKSLIEERIGISLKNYKFLLQGNQELESHRNLTDQCVQGEGLVQINFQVLVAKKAINIVDVLKPAEDFFLDDDSEKSSRETEDEDISKGDGIVQWHVDVNFQNEIERLRMPHDPMNWNVIHVRHWLQWAVRQFNLPNIKLSDWSMNGEKLYELTLAEFQKLVPTDPGGIFWAHFELLRKMKVIAVRNDDISNVPVRRKPKLMEQSKTTKGKQNFCTSTPIKYFDNSLTSRNHYNGQIQLWQFLLELLTTTDYKTIIQWIGTDGEFKLINPEAVAQLWGERKNKPKMNYEKLSRALRYYYDGDMISKVHGKRFVYKFVCDLQQLIGYTPLELSNLVSYGNPRRIS